MIISTEEIVENGGYSYTAEIDNISKFSLAYPVDLAELMSPLNVEFDISVGSKEFLLLGEVEGKFRLTCSRCNEPFFGIFKQDMEETYALDIVQIDASEQIRQAVVLALPEKPLCQDDCRGLCLQCGANLNKGQCACKPITSSPFAKLKNLYH